jgi:hypothetical protein
MEFTDFVLQTVLAQNDVVLLHTALKVLTNQHIDPDDLMIISHVTPDGSLTDTNSKP